MDALLSPQDAEVPFSESAPVLDATLTLLAEIGTTESIADMAAEDGPADSDAVGEGRMGGLPAFLRGETAATVPLELGGLYGWTGPASVVSGRENRRRRGGALSERLWRHFSRTIYVTRRMITRTKPAATPPAIVPAVLTLMVFDPNPLEDITVAAATPEEDDPVGFCEGEV